MFAKFLNLSPCLLRIKKSRRLESNMMSDCRRFKLRISYFSKLMKLSHWPWSLKKFLMLWQHQHYSHYFFLQCCLVPMPSFVVQLFAFQWVIHQKASNKSDFWFRHNLQSPLCLPATSQNFILHSSSIGQSLTYIKGCDLRLQAAAPVTRWRLRFLVQALII